MQYKLFFPRRYNLPSLAAGEAMKLSSSLFSVSLSNRVEAIHRARTLACSLNATWVTAPNAGG